MGGRPVRLATRGSALARWQAEWAARALGGAAELVIVETAGDRRQDVALHAIGGQGVFVKEVQAAVLEGRADAAVHSAKDLPSAVAPGLVLAAFGAREDPRDALVGSRLDELAVGGRVATGSVRRRAQLAHLRPDLVFADLRGNIATRLAKADGFDAVIMAAAALRRLGLGGRIAEVLDPEVMVPQAGQGAIALECRAGDEEMAERLAALDHAPTRRAVEAERAFLALLGGGCTLPVGAFATAVDGGPRLHMVAVIASLDGAVCLRHRADGHDPGRLGVAVGEHLLRSAVGTALLPPSGASAAPPPAGAPGRGLETSAEPGGAGEDGMGSGAPSSPAPRPGHDPGVSPAPRLGHDPGVSPAPRPGHDPGVSPAGGR